MNSSIPPAPEAQIHAIQMPAQAAVAELHFQSDEKGNHLEHEDRDEPNESQNLRVGW